MCVYQATAIGDNKDIRILLAFCFCSLDVWTTNGIRWCSSNDFEPRMHDSVIYVYIYSSICTSNILLLVNNVDKLLLVYDYDKQKRWTKKIQQWLKNDSFFFLFNILLWCFIYQRCFMQLFLFSRNAHSFLLIPSWLLFIFLFVIFCVFFLCISRAG